MRMRVDVHVATRAWRARGRMLIAADPTGARTPAREPNGCGVNGLDPRCDDREQASTVAARDIGRAAPRPWSGAALDRSLTYRNGRAHAPRGSAERRLPLPTSETCKVF